MTPASSPPDLQTPDLVFWRSNHTDWSKEIWDVIEKHATRGTRMLSVVYYDRDRHDIPIGATFFIWFDINDQPSDMKQGFYKWGMDHGWILVGSS